MSPTIMELDGKTIEALASGTRRGILKKLMSAPRTLSDLSRSLDINKSAISRHLGILEEAGMIARKDSESEFVYYELTARGKGILGRNENIKLVIILSSLITAMNLGIIAIYTYYKKFQANLDSAHNTFGISTGPAGYWSYLPASVRDIAILIAGILLILASIYIASHVIKKLSNDPKE